MEHKLKQLEDKLRNQRMYTLILFLLFCTGFIFSFRGNEEFNVIRAKGIIIVDSLENERILIGAPIPYAKNRVRTDTARVKEIWGKNSSKQYMQWYKNYNHSANGMIILDDKGFDRIAIGDPTPDPNIGKRIGPATGIEINDEMGYERSGYNLINIDGNNRLVLGFDRQGGSEGLTLGILEDGTAGVGVNNKNNNLFMGNAPKSSFVTGLSNPFFGLLVSDSGKVKYNFNSHDK